MLTDQSVRILIAVLAAAFFAFGATASPGDPVAGSAPTARDFARLAALSDVSISQDGKHIVGVMSPDGLTPYIAVWQTAAPNAKPSILSATRMTIVGVDFLKNDRLGVTARQTITFGSTKGHLFKYFITDLEGKTWTSALPEPNTGTEEERFMKELGAVDLLSDLPNDPQHILVQDLNPLGGGDIFKVNIYTSQVERVEHGSDRFGAPQADSKGEVRARQEVNFKDGAVYIAQWIKNPKTGAWEEHFRSYAKDRAIREVVGFTDDPNIIYVAVDEGRDKTAIYEYDIAQRKLLEPAFQHRLFSALGLHHARDGRTLGFVYGAESPKTYWIDGQFDAIAKSLPAALGLKTTPVTWTDPGGGGTATIQVTDGAEATISSWSDDFKQMIVVKSGPNQPPEYYLLSDGAKLTLLGRSRPQINPASLGDTRLVEYPARDGLMIPAFLHTPPKAVYGPGPYPALVLPHGGPWARDYMGWDVSGWTKYFTSHGFVVIQPQFRGSQGWGAKLWRAGDREWGGKMQDDNDDAAKWLIAQGLAAPNRIALFGYSYGGYAAFAAGIRPNGLYQCAISGAGVAELKDFQRDTYEDRFIREFQRPTIEGLDVLAHAREVSIPMFIYGGDRDQTVNPNNPKRFADALKAAGKPYRYLEIKDMGHQYVTMTAQMLETQLVEIERFLKTECKPGGI